MKILSAVLLFFAIISCHSKDDEISYDIRGHRYDTGVINKLPLYDSLANVLIASYSSIQKQFKEDEAYYRYTFSSANKDLFEKLPAENAAKINEYFTRLGRNFIYSFQFFKDSSIKIFVRNTYLKDHNLDVGERLSYYPTGTGIRKREHPYKDTLLNKHWQYWISFDKRGLTIFN